jgi:hypothetical protein
MPVGRHRRNGGAGSALCVQSWSSPCGLRLVGAACGGILPNYAMLSCAPSRGEQSQQGPSSRAILRSSMRPAAPVQRLARGNTPNAISVGGSGSGCRAQEGHTGWCVGASAYAAETIASAYAAVVG